MNTLQVVNIKCGGCQKNIISTLEKEGYANISVNLEKQTVAFDGDSEKAKAILSRMGYPEINTDEAKSMLKKAKSYVSCAIGKIK